MSILVLGGAGYILSLIHIYQTLMERLKAAGIPLARRTIAKYRESLGIPSAAQRKR